MMQSELDSIRSGVARCLAVLLDMFAWLKILLTRADRVERCTGAGIEKGA
jgi:hypothetical protein